MSPGDGFDAEPFMPHPPVEIDAQTESNHDTALTIACAGGHDELVQMLLDKQANMEHRDKKGMIDYLLLLQTGFKTVFQFKVTRAIDVYNGNVKKYMI